MLSYFDLRKGIRFLLDGQPYEVLDFHQVGKAQDIVVAQTKIKNLINGKVVEKSFKEGEVFEEAEIEKFDVKFLYAHRGEFWFCEANDPSKRFELTENQLEKGVKFLKSNQTFTGVKFQDKIINIVLPVKVHLKVTDAPPGVKGERAQAGTKQVILETGAVINVPLFIENGDMIEINTESEEYIRRVENTK